MSFGLAGSITGNLNYLKTLPKLQPHLYNFLFFSRFEPIHNILNLEEFEQILLNIFNYKASVNFYMFHGGGINLYMESDICRWNLHILSGLTWQNKPGKYVSLDRRL